LGFEIDDFQQLTICRTIITTQHAIIESRNTSIAMITNEGFKQFMANNGHLFPYYDIRCTRNSIFPKWLLLKTNQNSLFRNDGWYLVPTSALRNDIVREIVVAKQGLPIPDQWDDIANCMEHWGRAIDSEWQQKVLAHLASYLVEHDAFDWKQVYYECISMLIEKKLHAVFVHYEVMSAAMMSFSNYFYDRCNRVDSFFCLAVACIKYADNLIMWNTPPPDTVPPDTVES
jgi:hypothetical protein